jgi:TetR/AcrR family transcriptional repressor of nem operon
MPKGTETRTMIIDKAINLINRNGFRNTSIQNIIDETGVKKGNLYFHFASKDELGIELLREAENRYFDYLAKSVKSSDPIGKINDILKAVLAYHRRRGFVGGCIFGNTALEMSDSGENYAEFIRSVFNRWIRIITGYLKEAEMKGLLAERIRPDSMARHIVASLEGSIMMARLYKREEPMLECIGYLRLMLRIH